MIRRSVWINYTKSGNEYVHYLYKSRTMRMMRILIEVLPLKKVLKAPSCFEEYMKWCNIVNWYRRKIVHMCSTKLWCCWSSSIIENTIPLDEASSSPSRNEWMTAMRDILDLMAANQVSELVHLPQIASALVISD